MCVQEINPFCHEWIAACHAKWNFSEMESHAFAFGVSDHEVACNFKLIIFHMIGWISTKGARLPAFRHKTDNKMKSMKYRLEKYRLKDNNLLLEMQQKCGIFENSKLKITHSFSAHKRKKPRQKQSKEAGCCCWCLLFFYFITESVVKGGSHNVIFYCLPECDGGHAW